VQNTRSSVTLSYPRIGARRCSFAAALVLAAACSAKSSDPTLQSQGSNAASGTAMTKPQPATIRCEQGSSKDLAGRRVGVMNVYEDDGMVAQVAINDPATGKTDQLELRAAAEVTIGDRRFRVEEILPAKAGARGAVILAPLEQP
jgi:hypothetical protein